MKLFKLSISLDVLINLLFDIHPLSDQTIASPWVWKVLSLVANIFYSIILIVVVLLSIFYVFMGIVGVTKKESKSSLLPKGNEPFVTIQIPTYNELAAIRCARRCLNFDYPADKMQIIIGDDSSDPEVSAKIDEFAAQYPTRIDVTRRGKNIGFKPGNLNHMLKFTKGEYITIFDSDFLPEPDYMRRVMNEFVNDPELSAVQARWNIKNYSQNFASILGGTISHVTHYLAFPFMKWYKGSGMIGGSAETIKKSDLHEIGDWRAGTLTEDIEASCELLLRGKKIIYLEDVVVECEAPYTVKDLYKQQMRWAYGNIMAFKRNLKPIMTSKTVPKENKWNVLIFASGYAFPFLLVFLLLLGGLNVFFLFKANPGYSIGIFFLGMFLNILITSGSFLSNIMVLFVLDRKKEIPLLLLATFTVGIECFIILIKEFIKHSLMEIWIGLS